MNLLGACQELPNESLTLGRSFLGFILQKSFSYKGFDGFGKGLVVDHSRGAKRVLPFAAIYMTW